MKLPIVLDFETYWSQDYSLRKMSMAEYVHHPEFELQGMGVADTATGGQVWLDGLKYTITDMADMLRSMDFGNRMVIAHNAPFEAMVCMVHLGIKPRLWVCTLGMARALLSSTVNKYDLDTVATKVLGDGYGKQDTEALGQMKGVSLRAAPTDILTVMLKRLGGYCMGDLAATAGVFATLKPHFPRSEVPILDWTVRMCSEPTLQLDVDKVRDYAAKVVSKREQLVVMLKHKYGLDKIDVTSAVRFTKVMQGYGVPAPTKISPTTGGIVVTWSKANRDVMKLLDHDNPDVRTLMKVRLKLASSIEVTRAKSYLKVAEAVPDNMWPVGINYGGADHTQRFSGNSNGGGNPQNLGRKSTLREAIQAPNGSKVVVSDSSNIELRVGAKLCNQTDVLELIAQGVGVYSWFASKIYNKPINKHDHPNERKLGKVAVLSLQYGSGAETFMNMASTGYGLRISLNEAQAIVDLYRATFDAVKQTWKHCDKILKNMAAGVYPVSPWPFITFEDHPLTLTPSVRLPSGLHIQYNKLRVENFELVYTGRFGKTSKVYGAMLFQAICQGLARQVVMEQSIRIHRKYPVGMSVHDETVNATSHPDECLAFGLKCMRTPPSWWPDLPLDAEGAIGETYADAK